MGGIEMDPVEMAARRMERIDCGIEMEGV